jgi:hypothetical protein
MREANQIVRKIKKTDVFPMHSLADLLLQKPVYLTDFAAHGSTGGQKTAKIRHGEQIARFAEHLETVKQMIAEGATNVEIAERIKIHTSSVSRYIVKQRLRKSVKERFEEKLGIVNRCISVGDPDWAIAKELGMGFYTVQRLIKELNLRAK